MSVTLEEIADKAEWEGGLDVALNWFEPSAVPEEIRQDWIRARSLKRDLDEAIERIQDVMVDRGVAL